jgi:hypothetical protein
MEEWVVPEHMKQLAGTTVNNFGYDKTNTVEYHFNKYGFRNKYNSGTSINVIGNSVSFGIGVNESFGDILSQRINLPCNNFSFGCYLHENHDYLTNLKKLIDRDCDDIFIIQINNLDRLRNDNTVVSGLDKITARNKFLNYFEQIDMMFRKRKLLLVYWDDQDYNLPKSIVKKIAIFNQFHLDHSINHHAYTFGMQSHRAIAKTLASLINANKFYYCST